MELPSVPYIPGQTPRPEDGQYDGLKDTARPGMSVAELAQCKAWSAGWELLDAGCFWEAHEVWEAVWLALPQNSAERRFVQAAIQLANGLLKKYEPKDPLRPPPGGDPYLVPLNQEQWQQTVNQIMADWGLPHKTTVAYDDLQIHI